MAAFQYKFSWRTAIYLLVVVYVFLDFKVLDGPLSRKLTKSRPTKEMTRQKIVRNGWVAIVNQEPITLEQLELATRRHLYQRSLNWDDLSPQYREQIKLASLHNLIDDTLIASFADSDDFDVPQTEINTFIMSWEKQFPTTEYLNERSAYQDLSKSDRDAQLAKIWTRKRWLEYKTDPGVGITDEQLKQWYEDSKQQQLSETHDPDAPFPSIYEPEKIQARHIFVSTVTKTEEEAETKIREAHQKLLEGEAFAATAEAYSEDTRTRLRGGELKWFTTQRVPEEFAQVVFAQEKNKLGEPFQVKIGWHLVEVTDHQPQRLVEYEEVKDEIYTFLTNEQRETSIQLLLKKLRHNASIELITENL